MWRSPCGSFAGCAVRGTDSGRARIRAADAGWERIRDGTRRRCIGAGGSQVLGGLEESRNDRTVAVDRADLSPRR
jgi:hypothetical protein